MVQIDFSRSLLIASPKVAKDTFFHRSLVYMDRYSKNGALGFIVNKPTDTKVIELLKTVGITKGKNYQTLCNLPVYIGGPVNQTSLYILYLSDADNQLIKVSSSEKLLKDLCAGTGPEKFLIMLGCSMWGAEQIELEYKNNSWIYLECVADIVFDDRAENRALLAAKHLGFDLNTLIVS